VAALISLALVTSVSSLVMAGPHVYAKMAGDGYLPGWLAVTHGPPRAAIGFQCALALLMLWTYSFEALLTYIGFTLNLSTAVTVVALMVLRRREGKSLHVPGFPMVPAAFLMGVVAIAAFTIVKRPLESLVGFGTIGAGLIVWFFSRNLLAARCPAVPPCDPCRKD
jgi:APA family basic amino acid/polyamine antiporter